MIEVTMSGKEYLELEIKAREYETLLETLIIGTLKVDPEEAYRQVIYECAANLPETQNMQKYVDMRVEAVKAELSKNTLAVQLLFKSDNLYFNPYNGHFTSYQWDGNVGIIEMSKEIGAMIERLRSGEILVNIDETEEEVE